MGGLWILGPLAPPPSPYACDNFPCPYCGAPPGGACIEDCVQYPITVEDDGSVRADRDTLMRWLLDRDGTTPDRLA